MPRYTREHATATGISSSTAIVAYRTHRRVPRRRTATRMARLPNSATDAPTCPEGKLEVGGAASRCGTSGRGRSTTRVTSRNTADCAATATAGKRASRSHRPRDTATRVTTASRVRAITLCVAGQQGQPLGEGRRGATAVRGQGAVDAVLRRQRPQAGERPGDQQPHAHHQGRLHRQQQQYGQASGAHGCAAFRSH